MQIPDTSAKFNALADLTDALMRLNDPIGARAVLADARNTVAQSSSLAAVEILMNFWCAPAKMMPPSISSKNILPARFRDLPTWPSRMSKLATSRPR